MREKNKQLLCNNQKCHVIKSKIHIMPCSNQQCQEKAVCAQALTNKQQREYTKGEYAKDGGWCVEVLTSLDLAFLRDALIFSYPGMFLRTTLCSIFPANCGIQAICRNWYKRTNGFFVKKIHIRSNGVGILFVVKETV
jgi:hypothetical protein